MTSRSALVRYGAAGLGAATLCLGLPLALSAAPASAQQTTSSAQQAASPCPSASSTATAQPTASATATASASPTATTSPSASATASTSASATATTSPSACPSASATATATTSASATSTTTPSPSVRPSQKLGISVSPNVITPGIAVKTTVTGSPGTSIELQAYSRPNTMYGQVRQGNIGPDGTIVFRVTPGTNTRLFARIIGGGTDTDSPSTVINVQTALSLTVVRNGRRDYTFKGRILPRRAGQLITLYRIDKGRRIITKQLKTDSTGTYLFRRVFTGSGRFGFLTHTGQTLTNAANDSNSGKARPTDIF